MALNLWKVYRGQFYKSTVFKKWWSMFKCSLLVTGIPLCYNCWFAWCRICCRRKLLSKNLEIIYQQGTWKYNKV